MAVLSAWLLFPLYFSVLLIGCGLAVDLLVVGNSKDHRLAAPLLFPLGFACLVVVGELALLFDSQVATAATVTIATIGLLLNPRMRGYWPLNRTQCLPSLRSALPFLLGAGFVFLVFSAPIIFSGQVGFLGYIKLDDTATWLAFTDYLSAGRPDLADLSPSSYLATIQANQSYPMGAFFPLLVADQLSSVDSIWLIQPLMSLSVVGLFSSLYCISKEFAVKAWQRAFSATLASCAALLLSYAFWGGIKEVETAMLIATSATCLDFNREKGQWRSLLPLVICAAALLSIYGPGAIVWLAFLGICLLALLLHKKQLRERLAALAVSLLVLGVLLVPLLATNQLLSPSNSTFVTSSSELGNLVAPLSMLHLAGVGFAEDFRVNPSNMLLTRIAALLVLTLAGFAVARLFRNKRKQMTMSYAITGLGGTLIIVAVGSPWIAGKAMAIASPIALFLAAAGLVQLSKARSTIAAFLATLLSLAVLASAFAAYHHAHLSPSKQLTELEKISHLIAGQGSTLMTEYQAYGVRHLLRGADAEGVSELRIRPIYLRDHTQAEKGQWVDTEQINPVSLFTYRTLVLRRSPIQSRPPLAYRLIWAGQYYTVWRRPASAMPSLDLPLGGGTAVSDYPRCSDVLELAKQGVADHHLAAIPGREQLFFNFDQHFKAPEDWRSNALPGYLTPDAAGHTTALIEVTHSGRYTFWLGGSVRSSLYLTIDGEQVGQVSQQLNPAGLYLDLGTAYLSPGTHNVDLRYQGPTWRPGSAGKDFPIGPLVLDRKVSTAPVIAPLNEARSLCGKRWDRIELQSN